MKVIVTEANAALSATQAFTVTVLLTNDCAQYNDLLAAATNGGTVTLTNCPTLVLPKMITIATNVILDTVSNNVTITGSF